MSTSRQIFQRVLRPIQMSQLILEYDKHLNKFGYVTACVQYNGMEGDSLVYVRFDFSFTDRDPWDMLCINTITQSMHFKKIPPRSHLGTTVMNRAIIRMKELLDLQELQKEFGTEEGLTITNI